MKEIISTNNAPAAVGPYSQAVKSGNLLFCSGQIALDPASGVLTGHDITTQTNNHAEYFRSPDSSRSNF